MSLPSQKDSLALKLKRFFFFPARLFVGFLVEIGKFRIWGAIVALIIVILIGDLLTKDGLILALFIVVYSLLYYLNGWFEKQEHG